MQMINVLHMNGGTGGTSYSNNSFLQKRILSTTKPIIEKALTSLYSNNFAKLGTLCIADLGCSSGPNTFFLISELIKISDRTRVKFGHNQSSEFHVYLNDLHENDFNVIFRSFPKFQEDLKRQRGSNFGPCFLNGVAGSFYGRLFPTQSLHFVHSSSSLHWLSQVPRGVEDNKGNICATSMSPPNVLGAYYKQFQRDFSKFLSCRSEEVVGGGQIVLTFLGRHNPGCNKACYIYELLAAVMHEMVLEGKIEEEKVNSFNIPLYAPSPEEVELEVEKEGSFMISHLEVFNVHWNASDDGFKDSQNKESAGYNFGKCIRSVHEPIIANHFGKSILDELFARYAMMVSDSMLREETEFVNITISMTKREN